MGNDVLEFFKLIVTIASVSCAIYFGIRTATRNKTQDDKHDADTLARIDVSLTTIKDSLGEVKSDLRGVIAENRELRDKVVAIESSCKSAHHRIDRLEGFNNDGRKAD